MHALLSHPIRQSFFNISLITLRWLSKLPPSWISVVDFSAIKGSRIDSISSKSIFTKFMALRAACFVAATIKRIGSPTYSTCRREALLIFLDCTESILSRDICSSDYLHNTWLSLCFAQINTSNPGMRSGSCRLQQRWIPSVLLSPAKTGQAQNFVTYVNPLLV